MRDNPGQALIKGATWSEIFDRKYVSKLATLCMAIWLHAANSMLTATTMPSAVEEIGGLNLISWTFALYLMGSIIAGASSSLLVTKFGLRTTMTRAAMVYAIGCAFCALAPSMSVILIGRILQGVGGGCLVALVYISQDRFFPNRLVPKVVACLSTVWMLSSFCGPMIGGAFATWGVWRMAYWAFAVQAVILIYFVHKLLSQETDDLDLVPERIPIVRLALLAISILSVSMAGSEFNWIRSPALLVFGLVALLIFIFRDKLASTARMLPLAATNISHTVGSGIATTFLLCLSIMSFLVYGPLILMKLYGLTPFTAGLIVLLESLAWGTAAVIFSGTSPETEGRLIRCGSAMVLIGLCCMAIIFPRGPLWMVVVIIIFGNGGFGMMWGFIIKRIIGAASANEKDRAASMVAVTQQTGFALGAALCGLIANGLGLSNEMGLDEFRHLTFWLFAGFVPIAIIGNITAWRFTQNTVTS